MPLGVLVRFQERKNNFFFPSLKLLCNISETPPKILLVVLIEEIRIVSTDYMWDYKNVLPLLLGRQINVFAAEELNRV